MEAATAQIDEVEEIIGELEIKLRKKRKLRKREIKKKSRSTRGELEN